MDKLRAVANKLLLTWVDEGKYSTADRIAFTKVNHTGVFFSVLIHVLFRVVMFQRNVGMFSHQLISIVNDNKYIGKLPHL